MSGVEIDVIVVGGGPSGVAAAVELRRLGIGQVVVLEREQELGGATRHCRHSPFGMLEFRRIYFGPAYARRLAREAVAAGVDIRTGHSVVELGADASLRVSSGKGVEHLRARLVLTTTGARETPRSARLISGDRPLGVITTGTLQSYVAFHGLMPFKRPVIVGSELVTLSAVLTCLSHGARPVAVIEPQSHPRVPAPLAWMPRLLGIPFHAGARIVDIVGSPRVSAVKFATAAGIREVECDGVLFTGQFTPESSLHMQSPLGVQGGSGGPCIDQFGQLENPRYFAAGNVLRGVETGGWAFREGRAVARAMCTQLKQAGLTSAERVAVEFEAPVKLVVPGAIRTGTAALPAFETFQLRVQRRVRGELVLEIDGVPEWRRVGHWLPERRILVPIPASALNAKRIRFRIAENEK